MLVAVRTLIYIKDWLFERKPWWSQSPKTFKIMTARIEWGQHLSLKSGVLLRLPWKEAVRDVKSMGEGWRLPTKEELVDACVLQLEDYHHSHFLIEDNLYWTGEECPDTQRAFGIFYERVKGKTYRSFNKQLKGFVRPVRDIA